MIIDEHNYIVNDSEVVTPAGAAPVYRVAGFWVRVLAFVIDLSVIGCFNGIILGVVFPATAKTSVIYDIIHINNLFLGITGVTYFILMTRYFQQTLGKMITGIKVIQPGDAPLDWSTVIFRELVARAISQMMGLYLGYIFCWFNKDKQCMHDMLSDTWVVHVDTKAREHYLTVPDPVV
jgi:uncharacterized RDD family membrane protein YckC